MRSKRMLIALVLASAFSLIASAPVSADGNHHGGRRGAVYTLSNEATGNAVIEFARSRDGELTQVASYPTGGLGSGMSLGSQGAVVLSNSGRLRFVAWNLLTLSTPIGRKMAPQVRKGGGPLLRIRRRDLERAGVERFEARTTGVSDGKPILADGTVLDVANVIWCTGFRPDYVWVDLPVIGEDGWPREFRGVADSSPGLYFLGIPFLYSFTSMLVIGAGRDAAYVVERVARRRGTRDPVRAATAGSEAS